MPGMIRTVLGDVDARKISGAVTHEHTLLYRGGELPRTKYVAAAMPALRKRLRHDFRELVKRGINCFVDCNTAQGLRIGEHLREIVRDTGMHLVVSTGYYTETSLPPVIKRMTASEMAAVFMKDVTEGIGTSDVKAGVVKVSGNGYEIERNEKKVFRAAAAVHRKTGVPITTHTPKGALRHVEFLAKHGVAPEKVALGHIESNAWQDVKEVASMGAMMIFTNWGGGQWVPEGMIVSEIVDLVRLGYVRQILIAVDMYLYYQNGRLKQRWAGGFLQIPYRVIPKLMKAGLKAKHIDTIMRDNPRRHLAF